jgi:hypothetical protein
MEVTVVDPVSVGLLLSVAGGVGGAVGTEAWQGLVALVKRPFVHSSELEAAASGLDELAALGQKPDDREAAARLASVLRARAEADADFRTAMQTWLVRAYAVFPASVGYVHNEISGGTQNGPVLLGRDFSGITIGATAPPPG